MIQYVPLMDIMIIPYYTSWHMSRTYRKQPTYIWRPVRTANELRQQYFDDDGYQVKTRHRYIPSLYDDIHISAYQQLWRLDAT